MFKASRRTLFGIGAAFTFVLAGGAWTMVPHRHDTLSTSINFPANEIQDNQYCVAGAQVSGGNPPYSYQWSGDYFSGTSILAGGYMYMRGGVITLDVTDSSSPTPQTGHADFYPNVGDYDYNDACDA